MNTAAINYKKNEVNYNFSPADTVGGYNSNGFVTGLINSLGATVPLPNQTVLPTPGADRPVPAPNFRREYRSNNYYRLFEMIKNDHAVYHLAFSDSCFINNSWMEGILMLLL